MSTKYIASNWRLPNKAGVDSYLNDNYGLDFVNTQSERINLSSSLDLGTNSSISIWINQETFGSVLLGEDSYSQDYLMFIDGTNIYIRIDGVVKSFAHSMVTDEWYNIVIIREGDSIEVFRNTTSLGTQTGYGTSVNTKFDTIGGKPNGTFPYNGFISQVSAFDYPLTSTQISTLYGSSSLGAGNPMATKPAPVAFYPLGDNSSGDPLTQPNEAVEDASVFEFVPNDYIEVNDSDSLSFGNGSTDSAFSVSTWVNFDDVTNSSLFSKSNIAPTFFEYSAHISSEQIVFGLYSQGDVSTSNNIFILGTPTLTSYEGSWINLTFTYDGSANASGMKIYLNGDEMSTSTVTNGTYVAMTNTSAPFKIGRSFNNRYLNGKMSNLQVWGTELSSSEVTTLYNSGVPLTGTQPQASSLKAWYKLDQSANWEADSTGAWQIPDAVSAYPQSFDFDGSNDFIDCGIIQGIRNVTKASFSCWLYRKTATPDQPYGVSVDTNNRVGLAIINNQLRFFVGGVRADVNNFITSDGWYNILIIYDGTQATASERVKVYKNGENTPLTNSPSIPATLGDLNTNFKIGLFTNGYLQGKLSNVVIWNSDQTTEKDNIYNSGVPAISYTNTPTAWYKLDNTATFSTNWSIPDASGNGNTGTSSGMTEQNLVNNNVSVLNGESSGMTSANLVLTDLTRNLPFDSYSFNFDGTSQINFGNDSSFNFTGGMTVSGWVIGSVGSGTKKLILKDDLSSQRSWQINVRTSSSNFPTANVRSSGVAAQVVGTKTLLDNNWHHFALVFTPNTSLAFFIDGEEAGTLTSGIPASIDVTTADVILGFNQYNGKASNFSIFDEALTSTEVLKLYSNGMPQDLSTFTPAPVAWWTLGSNSFFNGTNFICKDLIGSNDGTSVNAGVDALQGNTPRSEANGTGTNQSIPENLVGTTKYSSNNSWSINQSESARVQDTP